MTQQTISQSQVLQRWDTLALQLREALTSEENSRLLWQICSAEHIPEERIYDVARTVSWTLLGFIHPEDMPQEIAGGANVPMPVANTLAEAIRRKILGPLENTLRTIYSPAPAEEPESLSVLRVQAKTPGGQIAGPPEGETPLPVKLPTPAAATQGPAPVLPPKAPLPPLPPPPASPAAPSPIDARPPVPPRPPVSPVPIPSANPSAVMPAIPARSAAPVPPAPAPALTVMPKPPAAVKPAPATIFVHEDQKFGPVASAPLIHPTLSSRGPEGRPIGGEPPVRATVELGGFAGARPQAPVSRTAGEAQTRIVHYGNLRTMLEETPLAAPATGGAAPSPLSRIAPSEPEIRFESAPNLTGQIRPVPAAPPTPPAIPKPAAQSPAAPAAFQPAAPLKPAASPAPASGPAPVPPRVPPAPQPPKNGSEVIDLMSFKKISGK